MNLLLFKHIHITNANAVAGLTWGFPAITHFLGFVEALNRRITHCGNDIDIVLDGCAVIAHRHQPHTYYQNNRGLRFTQSRNPPCLHGINKKEDTAPVIEEGKMNLDVSLLIPYTGKLGYQSETFITWLGKQCRLQHLAGGTIQHIEDISLYNMDNEHAVAQQLRRLRRELLPGFFLRDRSDLMAALSEGRDSADPLDNWLNIIRFISESRPCSDLIEAHLVANATEDIQGLWKKHLSTPYRGATHIPEALKAYFTTLDKRRNKALLAQWQAYLEPTKQTPATWQYVPKCASGYLVPIMSGYKAISAVENNENVQAARDSNTDVCFVEAIHSIAEWRSVHRIKDLSDLQQTLWHYHYNQNWYLCRTSTVASTITDDIVDELLEQLL